jgi:hypothetical protein
MGIPRRYLSYSTQVPTTRQTPQAGNKRATEIFNQDYSDTCFAPLRSASPWADYSRNLVRHFMAYLHISHHKLWLPPTPYYWCISGERIFGRLFESCFSFLRKIVTHESHNVSRQTIRWGCPPPAPDYCIAPFFFEPSATSAEKAE